MHVDIDLDRRLARRQARIVFFLLGRGRRHSGSTSTLLKASAKAHVFSGLTFLLASPSNGWSHS
jgi:hypothetical protein